MLQETRKFNKDEAFYTLVPTPGKRCELCIKYRPVNKTSPPAGLCEDVFGIIDPAASCDEFIAKLPNRNERH